MVSCKYYNSCETFIDYTHIVILVSVKNYYSLVMVLIILLRGGETHTF